MKHTPTFLLMAALLTCSSGLDTNLNVQDRYIRSFTFHTDPVTGVEYVFAGGSNGKLYKGSYDASLPNRIYWDPAPELVMLSGERFHSGAVCNGRLYVAGGRNIQTPWEGGVYLRTDGPNPSWKRVYVFPENNNQSMRALTAVPDPLNPASEVLVGTREIAGVIERIVPMPNDTVEVILEMDIRQSFTNNSVDFSILPAGIYLLRITNDQRETQTIKIIKK